MDRREILKMFGVAAATAVPVAAAARVTSVERHVIGATSGDEALVRTFDFAPPPPPEGMTYQWKRVFIASDEPDFRNIANMIDAGWKPVPASRHREKYPDNGSYWVEIGGMVLMEKSAKGIPPPRKYPEPHDEHAGFVEIDGHGMIIEE
jgi:hypothetical protein